MNRDVRLAIMKILRLVLRIGPTSAPYNQFTLPLLDAHDVTLCTYHRVTEAADCRIDLAEGDGRLRGYVKRLWTLLRARPFDVVHVHSPHLALLFLVVGLFAAPRLVLRSILHVHSSYHVLRWRNRWMLLPAFMLFGRVVCCSNASRRSFPWLYRTLAGRRLLTICNGVDLRRVDRVWTPLGAGTIDRGRDLELVSIGNLRPLKNHETVIRALASVNARDVRLTIISDGPSRAALVQLAKELGVGDRVQLVGQIARDAVLQYLWRADAFVSMSLGEGLPVAVLEAMSCHCPVALSDIPPHREIRGRRAGLIPLFEPDDDRQLAEAIDDWASMPLDVLRAWGADCRQHVEWDYSLDWMLDQFQVVLDEFDPSVVPTPEWNVFCRSVGTKRRTRRVA